MELMSMFESGPGSESDDALSGEEEDLLIDFETAIDEE